MNPFSPGELVRVKEDYRSSTLRQHKGLFMVCFTEVPAMVFCRSCIDPTGGEWIFTNKELERVA